LLPGYAPIMAIETGVQVGARVPDFALSAANRDGTWRLFELLQHAPVVVEFLRGTW
jgi:peroxiredoxin